MGSYIFKGLIISTTKRLNMEFSLKMDVNTVVNNIYAINSFLRYEDI